MLKPRHRIPSLRPRLRGSTPLLGAMLLLAPLASSPAQTDTPGAPAPDAATPATPSSLIFLVFEGFSPVLVAASETPNLDRMAAAGAWTHRLLAAYPTTPWVNGASLATGCQPQHHGIVGDTFLDPERGRFDAGPLRGWLASCEPLAAVASRQGLRTAALGWYGTAGEDEDTAPPPERCEGDFRHRDAERRDAVRNLLAAPPEQRPQLLLARFCSPGAELRAAGVQSEAGIAAVEEIDAFLGQLLRIANTAPTPADREASAPPPRQAADPAASPLVETENTATAAPAPVPDLAQSPVAFFVASPLGMRDVSHLINLERILHREAIEGQLLARGNTAFLYLPPGTDAERVAAQLTAYRPLEVLRKTALPLYAQLGEGPRVPPLILSAYPPYFLAESERWPFWLRGLAAIGPDYVWAELWRSAASGFTPRTPSMFGLFYAAGAGIAPTGRLGALQVIDLHPTAAQLLGITPGTPLDGRIATPLLHPPPGGARKRGP